MSAITAVANVAAAASNDGAEPRNNCFDCADDRNLWTRLWQGIAAASVAVNIAAIVALGSAVTFVAGLVTASVIASVVIYLLFQRKEIDSPLNFVRVLCSACRVSSKFINSFIRFTLTLRYARCSSQFCAWSKTR